MYLLSGKTNIGDTCTGIVGVVLEKDSLFFNNNEQYNTNHIKLTKKNIFLRNCFLKKD